MRIIIILLLFAVGFIIGCKTSQVRNPSTSGAAPNKIQKPVSDSAVFVRTIAANKQKYVGKEFRVLLNDLDIPVKSYYIGKMFQKNYSNGISISLDDWGTTLNKERGVRGAKNPVELFIEWDKPILRSGIEAALTRAAGDWRPEEEKFYSKLIVKDIR